MKFRWLIQYEDYSFDGTNDEKVALAAAEDDIVVDVLEGKLLHIRHGDEGEKTLSTEDIPEYQELVAGDEL